MHQKVNKTPANARFDDSLNFVVGSIGEVRDRPAGINEDLVVKRVDQLGQDSESRGDLRK